jgi:hypothetical protein
MTAHFAAISLVLLSLISSAHSLPFITNSTVDILNRSINKVDYSMMVITLKSPEGFPALDQSVNTLWVVTSSSLLFDTKPYMMYYTFNTIAKTFLFNTLELTEQGFSLLSNRSGKASPFMHLVLQETALTKFPRNKLGDLSMCSWDMSVSQSSHDEYFTYLCANLTTLEESTPVISDFIVLEDVCYVTIQVVITGYLVQQFLFSMHIMRKDRKFKYVTDTTKINPPFWQCVFPLKSRYLAKFRIWDSIALARLFIIICVLSFISQIFPSVWPSSALGYDFSVFGNRAVYYYPNSVIILVSGILFVYLLIIENKQNRHKKLPKYVNENVVVTYLVRIVLSIAIVGVMAGLFGLDIAFLMPTTTVSYRYALWSVSVVFYLIALMVMLHSKVFTIDRIIYNKMITHRDTSLNQKLLVEDTDTQMTEKSTDIEVQSTRSFTILIFTVVSWIIFSLWLTTLTMMIFHSGLVVTRFIRATITNMLLNLDTITTYTFCFTTVGIAYKIISDIEAPYVKMKNNVCKLRGSLHISIIKKNNQKVRNGEITKDPVYYIPMTWSLFLRICKILRVPSMTYSVITQMIITVFTLVLFLVTVNTKGKDLFNGSGDSKTLFTLVLGTFIPFIPVSVGLGF